MEKLLKRTTPYEISLEELAGTLAPVSEKKKKSSRSSKRRVGAALGMILAMLPGDGRCRPIWPRRIETRGPAAVIKPVSFKNTRRP